MLNRFVNLARRQKPQPFPPRKRAMATTSFGQPRAEDAELATFVVEDAELGAPLLAAPPQAGRQAPTEAAELGWSAASSGGFPGGAPSRTAEEPGLALGQMRLAIEHGLLMVFGPEGDPVPPHAFAAAAATHPATPLALPDGTTALASRVAAVLGAQSLGRLGAVDQAAGWILAMLREGGGLELASDDQLRAEQIAPGSQPTVATDAAGVAAGVPPESDEQPPSCDREQTAAAEADAAPATPQDENAAACEALDQASPDRAAASTEPSHAPAMPWSELDPEEPTLTDSGPYLDAEENSQADAAEDAQADAAGDLGAGDPGAGEPGLVKDGGTATADDAASPAGPRMIALELNPPALAGGAFNALVIRDLPAGARLSAGAYDPAIDGWVLRPQDLGALAIMLPPELHADFTVTLLGVALRRGDPNAARVLARLPVRLA
jgi:hypothetical protein